MRDLGELSGRWIGWWIQSGHRGHMRLTLSFANGTIAGEGSDDDGWFSLLGNYGDDFARMAKRYGWYEVLYDGRWDGRSIAGPWAILYEGFTDRGEFEMWPERDGISIESLLESMENARVWKRELNPSASIRSARRA